MVSTSLDVLWGLLEATKSTVDVGFMLPKCPEVCLTDLQWRLYANPFSLSPGAGQLAGVGSSSWSVFC